MKKFSQSRLRYEFLSNVSEQLRSNPTIETAPLEPFQSGERHLEFAELLLERAQKAEDPQHSAGCTMQPAVVYAEKLEHRARGSRSRVA